MEQAAARAERKGIDRRGRLAPASIDEPQLATLREQLARYPQIGRAWHARKVTMLAPDSPYYILGIARIEPWWRPPAEGSNNYLARKLAEELQLPGQTLIVILTRKRAWLRRRLKRVADAEVYRRDHRSPATDARA